MRSKKRFRMIVVLCMVGILSVIPVGCGNDDNTAPYDAEIIFAPSEITASIAFDTCFDDSVTVLFADGTPMSQAQVTISGSFASPRQGAGSRYFFYEGRCDLPLDAANYRDSGFKGETDDNGVYHFAVLVTAASGTFTDTIYATSGVIFAAQDLSIE